MYIYKFIITYVDGRTLREWLACEQGESIAKLQTRADEYMDSLESDTNVVSVRRTRRLVPGI